jgi:Choline dehydrogenase and related flavoproteins
MGQVTIAARSRYCPTELRDLFVFPGLEPLDDGGYEISAGAFVMKTTSRGSVRLNSDDPRVPLAIDHGFLNDPTDAEMLEDAIARYASSRRARPCDGTPRTKFVLVQDLDAATLVRTSARGFFHPTGTCAIGRVVDGDGRVIGFDNLYVADASIIPSIPRVNPNLTVAAVAEKLAVSLAAT